MRGGGEGLSWVSGVWVSRCIEINRKGSKIKRLLDLTLIVFIVVSERKYVSIPGRPTSVVRESGFVLRKRILPGYCFFFKS